MNTFQKQLYSMLCAHLNKIRRLFQFHVTSSRTAVSLTHLQRNPSDVDKEPNTNKQNTSSNLPNIAIYSSFFHSSFLIHMMPGNKCPLLDGVLFLR